MNVSVSRTLGMSVLFAWSMFAALPARGEVVKPEDLIAKILSPEGSGRSEAARIIDYEPEKLPKSEELVRQLISIVESPLEPREPYYTSNTSRNLAMRALGKLRAEAAVPVLIEWLLPKEGQTTFIWRLMQFGHAGYALVEIGDPAVPALVDRLSREPDSRLGRECLKVTVAIVGLAKTKELLVERSRKLDLAFQQADDPDTVLVALDKRAAKRKQQEKK